MVGFCRVKRFNGMLFLNKIQCQIHARFKRTDTISAVIITQKPNYVY